MKNSIVVKIVLGLSGVLITIPGIMALIAPLKFAARNDIDLSSNLGLMNDYRATGGLMLAAGVIIILGVIHKRMAFTSSVVAAVTYTLLTLGRLLSIAIDGTPVDGLVKATVAEGVVAILAIVLLAKYRNRPENA